LQSLEEEMWVLLIKDDTMIGEVIQEALKDASACGQAY